MRARSAWHLDVGLGLRVPPRAPQSHMGHGILSDTALRGCSEHPCSPLHCVRQHHQVAFPSGYSALGAGIRATVSGLREGHFCGQGKGQVLGLGSVGESRPSVRPHCVLGRPWGALEQGSDLLTVLYLGILSSSLLRWGLQRLSAHPLGAAVDLLSP